LKRLSPRSAGNAIAHAGDFFLTRGADGPMESWGWQPESWPARLASRAKPKQRPPFFPALPMVAKRNHIPALRCWLKPAGWSKGSHFPLAARCRLIRGPGLSLRRRRCPERTWSFSHRRQPSGAAPPWVAAVRQNRAEAVDDPFNRPAAAHGKRGGDHRPLLRAGARQGSLNFSGGARNPDLVRQKGPAVSGLFNAIRLWPMMPAAARRARVGDVFLWPRGPAEHRPRCRGLGPARWWPLGCPGETAAHPPWMANGTQAGPTTWRSPARCQRRSRCPGGFAFRRAAGC